MARTKVSGGDAIYFRAKDLEVGQKLVGKYIAEHTDQFQNPCWKFLNTAGETVIVNSTASLKREMANVEPGDFAEIVYQGSVTLEKGPNKGKPCHTFEVFLLTGDDIPAMQKLETVVPESDDCPI